MAMDCLTADTASGLTEIDVIPNRTRCSANSGRLDGAWPHNDEVMPGVLAPVDDAADGVEDGRVCLVEQIGAHLGVAVHTEHELREVVAPDRHAVDSHGRVLRDEEGDRGHLGHDPHGQRSRDGAGADDVEAGFELPLRADEGDHEPQVRCLFDHLGENVELETEEVGLLHVAVAAAIADHGIFFLGFETLSTFETAELVGAEIDAAIHDGPGREGSGDAKKRRRHRVHKGLLLPAFEEEPRVYSAQSVHDHEFGPEEPDAVDIQSGDFLGVLGDGEVDVKTSSEHRRAWPVPRLAPSWAPSEACPRFPGVMLAVTSDTAPS